MAKEGAIQIEGAVLEPLLNGYKNLTHVSGKIRIGYIKILPGDKVTVEMSPYNLSRGRITYRVK